MVLLGLTPVRHNPGNDVAEELLLISFIGLIFLAAACAALFVGVQIMFETREQELRQGIGLKC